MEEHSLETIEDLQKCVSWLGYSAESEEHERLALKCIQRAQFFKDVDIEFKARLAYIRIVTFLNKDELSIAMFPWILKKCDEDRERFNYTSALWQYKWVFNSVKEFANIPKAKLDSILDDLLNRIKDSSKGDKIIHYFKMLYYNTIGEIEKADEEYELYLNATGTSWMDDCSACQPNNIIDYLLNKEKYTEVFDIADLIIKGEKSCLTVPERTYPKLVLAALLSQRFEEAEHFQVLAKKHLKLDQNNLTEASYLLIYYSVKEDFTKARNIIEKQFPFLISKSTDLNKYYFYLSLKTFFTQLIYKNIKEIKLDIVVNEHFYNKESIYQVEESLKYFNHQLLDICQKLDHRNGNNFYHNFINRMERDISNLINKIPKS